MQRWFCLQLYTAVQFTITLCSDLLNSTFRLLCSYHLQVHGGRKKDRKIKRKGKIPKEPSFNFP